MGIFGPGFVYAPRPPLTRNAIPKPATADAIPMIAICTPLRVGLPIVVLAFHQPMRNRVIVLTMRETTTPRRISFPMTMNGISGTRDPRTAAMPTRIALFWAWVFSTGARMIVIGSERFLDATATPRMTPNTLTSPSWLPRMKSDRRPGCACFSASASSSIFRQNAKRVAMNPALHPKSQSDLTVAPGSEIMRPVLLAVRGEGFSKHLVMGATDGGRGPPVAPDGGRDRGGRLPARRRRGGRQGIPRQGPATRTRPRRGPRRRLAL